MFHSKGVVSGVLSTLIASTAWSQALSADVPPPPDPEPIEVYTLPLPPVAPSSAGGSCTTEVNPLGNGCVLKTGGLIQTGSFLPDNNHVLAVVNFTGAPAAPDAASVYSGPQTIIIKSDGDTFSGGSPWKCITCGMPEGNAQGRAEALDYPQAFRDGKRILVGTNIIDCGEFDLASDECVPGQTYMYPLRFNTAVDGSGEGGEMRELRLHPDDEHIGFSIFVMGVSLMQYAYVGRLAFNPSPENGLPLVPRYDVVNVTVLFSEDPKTQPLLIDVDQIRINPDEISVGELRGFSGDGKEVTYVGYPRESSNIDVFAVELATGAVRRLTSHPEYCDPLDISADNKWIIAMDTRGTDRQMFMAGMRNIPPLTDQVSVTAASSTRNNGQRRFFQPFLIDGYGDRGDYYGQQVNGDGDGSPGSVNDPEWNGRADPKFSLDVTRAAYWQALTIAPACGGNNPLPCPESTEPGGRTERAMVAHFTSRKPYTPGPVEPMTEAIPWATPYKPGWEPPPRQFPPEGVYTLLGSASGSAEVVFTENQAGTALQSVAVTYSDYSDDNVTFLNGFENVTSENSTVTLNIVHWYSDLVQTGGTNATKFTSPDGFHLEIDVLINNLNANGTLSTEIDGKLYTQPANGT